MNVTYETHAKGIRILPGQWRPHYPFEHVVWVSPSWPSQEYVWLDFPEAIFADVGLLYLSHVNPAFPVLFADLPQVLWKTCHGGLSFERVLPNDVGFGGSLATANDSIVSLQLWIENGSSVPLRNIKLQTCAYLRGIKEFSAYTMRNKLVHLWAQGWQSFDVATTFTPENGSFHLGWRGGPKIADLPAIVTSSAQKERLVAFTWYDKTYALVGNPHHPCMHADPMFPDLEPGQREEIRGELLFFEGLLEEFTPWFTQRSALNTKCV